MRIRKEAQLQVGEVIYAILRSDFDCRFKKKDGYVNVTVTGVYPDLITGTIHHEPGAYCGAYDETVSITNVQLVQILDEAIHPSVDDMQRGFNSYQERTIAEHESVSFHESAADAAQNLAERANRIAYILWLYRHRYLHNSPHQG